MFRNVLFVSLILLVPKLSVFQAVAVSPVALTLAWDPSSDPSVVGYRLYDGMASLNYTNVVDVGSNLSVTISGLVAGATYYFAVTAYDSTGLESTFSGQISYVVPATAPRPPMLAQLFLSRDRSLQAILSGTGPAGFVYDVCASMDLSSWSVIGSVTVDASGSFQFTDADSPGVPGRFYRLKQNTP